MRVRRERAPSARRSAPDSASGESAEVRSESAGRGAWSQLRRGLRAGRRAVAWADQLFLRVVRCADEGSCLRPWLVRCSNVRRWLVRCSNGAGPVARPRSNDDSSGAGPVARPCSNDGSSGAGQSASALAYAASRSARMSANTASIAATPCAQTFSRFISATRSWSGLRTGRARSSASEVVERST